MSYNILSHKIKKVGPASVMMMIMTLFCSCEKLFDGIQPCHLQLRFVFDYNMEFANAFTSQVDCLNVYVYNDEGRCVESYTVGQEDTSREEWRLPVSVEPGKYTILAYGGMNCGKHSFSFVSNPVDTRLEEVMVDLNRVLSVGTTTHSGISDSMLQNLFYGRLEIEIPQNFTNNTEATVKMMRDTHDLRVLLQQVDGEVINPGMFEFKVVVDNSTLGWNNDIIPRGNTFYYPWDKGSATPGTLQDGEKATVVFAELSFSRLVTAGQPRLIITRTDNDEKIVDIPLINYLLLLKSSRFEDMGSQEYLDREARWEMIFFLDKKYNWLQTHIVINDWVVRLNQSDF